MTRWVDYDSSQIPVAYDRARTHSAAVRELWLRTVSRYARPGSVSRILDLGCGTGRFAAPLAEHYGCPVCGVDPALTMLRQARAKAGADDIDVSCVRGRGEALPLRRGCVELVFISMVFHHFREPLRVAQECRRVLRENGVVFLRAASREQIPDYAYVPFFPESIPLLEETLPAAGLMREVFEEAGLALVEQGVVTQEVASSYEEYADKIAAGGDSVLARLPDGDFSTGLERLRAHAAKAGDQPVIEPIDFFVFRGGGK